MSTKTLPKSRNCGVVHGPTGVHLNSLNLAACLPSTVSPFPAGSCPLVILQPELLDWNNPPKTPSLIIFSSCVLWCSLGSLKEFLSYLQALHILLCQTGSPKFPATVVTDTVSRAGSGALWAFLVFCVPVLPKAVSQIHLLAWALSLMTDLNQR